MIGGACAPRRAGVALGPHACADRRVRRASIRNGDGAAHRQRLSRASLFAAGSAVRTGRLRPAKAGVLDYDQPPPLKP
ncbi:hypothetical protein QZM22_11510 [Burkholderia oklahomensis]|uniref:hypothetical protein n=1 Tax=Burkholderia oklahomensis TaxID=342113 RepID=UPI00264EEA40|nr:hypothetical protein [Burkholderia oklahomensis]MDN7673128.1 hypothetical protein [Burkholderia oklahomensis]